MSTDDKIRFPPLNDGNYMEWSIHMGAELICKGLWDNIQCEVSLEGRNNMEMEEIVTKWHRKRTQKKMAETCMEMVKDSQLMHICTCNPEVLWRNLLPLTYRNQCGCH